MKYVAPSAVFSCSALDCEVKERWKTSIVILDNKMDSNYDIVILFLKGITMSYLVGPKGQIVISKSIRERLGVKPGWVALQRLVGDRVEVYFLPPEHRDSLKGSLAKYSRTHIPQGEAWENARNAAWETAARDKYSQEPES